MSVRSGEAERRVLSVLSHTRKIKVLMAWASSNGTPCMCVCTHQQSCIQNGSCLAAALRHSGLVFLSFYLQLPPSLCVHVGIYSHAPTVSRLQSRTARPHVWWFSLPCTSSHMYHITSRCCGSELAYFSVGALALPSQHVIPRSRS